MLANKKQKLIARMKKVKNKNTKLHTPKINWFEKLKNLKNHSTYKIENI